MQLKLFEWVESVKLVMYMCVKGIDFVSLFHFNAPFSDKS